MKTRAEWLASLNRKISGTGAYLFDKQGNLLIVKPTYKDGWSVPGGVIEENESPLSCINREIFEELGIEIKIKKLLILDYRIDPDIESYQFIFTGETISETHKQQIQLQESELSEIKFLPINEAKLLLRESHKNRLTSLNGDFETFRYMENRIIKLH
ncbi:MAG: NUDIX hydrolase [Candidatus Gracilibacteria bacterium]|jgi:8-oxo-dGTP pyrophosphatase MutT (NUDIX family)|nr:NUDIX hydrolase [Candidatus Gracilibacteria bacterium]